MVFAAIGKRHCITLLIIFSMVPSVSAMESCAQSYMQELLEAVGPYKIAVLVGCATTGVYHWLIGGSAEQMPGLHQAAAHGYLDGIKYHFSCGCAIDQTNGPKKLTPLHLAAVGGHREIVQFLVNRGADRTALTADGLTPADLAQSAGHRDIVEFLTGLAV